MEDRASRAAWICGWVVTIRDAAPPAPTTRIDRVPGSADDPVPCMTAGYSRSQADGGLPKVWLSWLGGDAFVCLMVFFMGVHAGSDLKGIIGEVLGHGYVGAGTCPDALSALMNWD